MSSLAAAHMLIKSRPAVLCGGVMVRLDLSYFYRLSLVFRALRDMPEDGTIQDVWFDMLKAQITLKEVFNASVMQGSLRSSSGPATVLHALLDEFVQAEMGGPFTQFDKGRIISALETFEATFQSELAVADAYMATDKSPYSTVQLITNGAALFSPEVKVKVPAALQDLENAGKCLAFELGTACGFHVMRAMEAVLRRYWEVVTGSEVHPKQRNIGAYLRLMEDKKCGHPKVIAALKQIKDLHRNAISHPEDNLTVNEAISLIGIARSVADAMLLHIPEHEFVLTAPDEGVPNITNDPA